MLVGCQSSIMRWENYNGVQDLGKALGGYGSLTILSCNTTIQLSSSCEVAWKASSSAM